MGKLYHSISKYPPESSFNRAFEKLENTGNYAVRFNLAQKRMKKLLPSLTHNIEGSMSSSLLKSLRAWPTGAQQLTNHLLVLIIIGAGILVVQKSLHFVGTAPFMNVDDSEGNV